MAMILGSVVLTYHCLGSQIVLLDSPSQNLFPDLNHQSKINFFVKTILNRLINN